MQRPEHFYSLDVVRGIGALSVVFWHWQHFFYDGTIPRGFQTENQPLYFLFLLFYRKGYLAVELFFTLSGFVFYWLYADKIARRVTSAKEFMLLRLSRLYPLHFVTLVVVALLQFAFLLSYGTTFVYENYDLYHFLLNLLFANSLGLENGFSFNGPAWSISVEVLLYTSFFICCRFLPVRGFLLLGISLMGTVVATVTNLGTARGISSFFLGGCAFLFYKQISSGNYRFPAKKVLYWFTALGWIGCVVGAAGFLPAVPTVRASVLRAGSTLFCSQLLFPATVVALALFESGSRKSLRRFGFIGEISYSSYLIHFPLQLTFAALIKQTNAGEEIYYSPYLLIGFLTVLIALSLGSYRFLEMPAQRALRALFLKSRQPAANVATVSANNECTHSPAA